MYYAVHDKVLSRNECYIICKIQVQPTYICRNFVWLTESRFKTFISKSFHWVLLKPYRINITLVFGHPPPHIKSRNWAFLSRLCCNKSIQRWKSGYCIMTTQKNDVHCIPGISIFLGLRTLDMFRLTRNLRVVSRRHYCILNNIPEVPGCLQWH